MPFPPMVVFYDLQTHSFEPSPIEPLSTIGRNGHGETDSDPIVCTCLQVRASTITRAVQEGGARSLCDVACSTGAGSGCTACHRRIRQFLVQRRAAAVEASSVPTAEIPAGCVPLGNIPLDGGDSSGLLHPRPSVTADSWPIRPR